MNDKIVKKTIIGIIFFGIVGMIYIYFSFSLVPEIKETEIKVKNDKNNISLYGSVVPKKSVSLSFENSGKIVSINNKVGDFVKEGTILAVQNSEQANVKLLQANTGVILAEANLESASKNLLKEKYKLKSLKNNDASSNDKKAQQAQIDSLKAVVDLQKASLSQAKDIARQANIEVSKYILRAPFNGIIINKNIEVGELINPNVPNASVLTMIEGEDADALEINVFASEQDIDKIKVGDIAKVSISGIDMEKFSAKISLIDIIKTNNNGNYSYKVTLIFDKKDDRIKPGMNVNVIIN